MCALDKNMITQNYDAHSNYENNRLRVWRRSQVSNADDDDGPIASSDGTLSVCFESVS